MAISTAREHGFPVDETAARTAVQITADYLDARRERILLGIAPPGGVDAMSYILFGLLAEQFSGDEATEAGARYLKFRQAEDGHWQIEAQRPPLESSSSKPPRCPSATSRFTRPPRNARCTPSVSPKARHGSQPPSLASMKTMFTRSLDLFGDKGLGAALAQPVAALTKRQQDDGGWRQLPGLESDAYATGQALVALQRAGLKTTDLVYEKRAWRSSLGRNCPMARGA